jgi:hypothetical protein
MRSVLIQKPRAMHAAPFTSRAYGGFSRAQALFISELIPDVSGLKIADPMCGQAVLAATWAHAGAHLFVADVSPGPLALAALRAPELVTRRDVLAERLCDTLGIFCSRHPRTPPVSDFDSMAPDIDDWLRPDIRADLALFGELIGLHDASDLPKAFRGRDTFRRFAIGICALAARHLTTFRLSDNITWLRPGGLAAPIAFDAALRNALAEWTRWAAGICLSQPRGSMALSLAVITEYAEKGFDAIVTSPPYANRLDYKRMWAPETSVVRALVRRGLHDVGPFIGTNTVEQVDVTQLRRLPRSVREALRSIQHHPAWGSSWYYYPFFAKYAVDLDAACRHIAGLLRRKGIAVIFGRDTIRKDTLFPTADVVVHAMRSSGCDVARRERAIIRSHIGNMRMSRDIGLYGRAQREWWLVLRKR